MEQKLIDSFHKKYSVDSDTGCWNWTASKNNKGYGQIGLNVGGKTKAYLAHRVSYELHKGKIDDGLIICHSCNNRACVNPEHLRKDTVQSNAIDCSHFGAGIGSQKLNLEQVQTIKQLLREGVLSQRSIAWMFNITQQTVNDINTGKAWNWTEDRT